MTEERDHTLGSGNVFADLDLPDADDELLKTDLAGEIRRVVEERGLTQAQAAALAGLAQSDVSAIVCYRLNGFSVERLLRCLAALGRDVTITVGPPQGARGRVALVSR